MNYLLLLVLLSPFTAWVVLAYFAFDTHKKGYPMVFSSINCCLLALAGISAISGLLNADLLSIGGSLVFIAFMYMNVWMHRHLDSNEKIEKVLRRFWFLSLVTGVIGVVEKSASLIWDMSWFAKLFFNPTYYPTKETYRIMSTFGNPNIAGDWFAILALISFYLMEKTTDNAKQSRQYMFGAVLFVANLMFTGSKGALIAFIVGIIFYCTLKKSKQLWHSLSIIMIFIGSSLIFSFDLFKTMNFRNEIWRRCFSMISEKPLFGSGFLGIYEKMGEPHAHNIWISLTTSLGFTSLIVLTIFSVIIVKHGIYIIKENVNMGRLTMSMMAILFVHGFVDFTLLAPQTSVLFFATAEIIYLLSKQTSELNVKQPKVYRLKKSMVRPYPYYKVQSK